MATAMASVAVATSRPNARRNSKNPNGPGKLCWGVGINSTRIGAPGGIRTHDPLIRNQVLYPLSYERAFGQRGLITKFFHGFDEQFGRVKTP